MVMLAVEELHLNETNVDDIDYLQRDGDDAIAICEECRDSWLEERRMMIAWHPPHFALHFATTIMCSYLLHI